jgi:hypothetical protein
MVDQNFLECGSLLPLFSTSGRFLSAFASC